MRAEAAQNALAPQSAKVTGLANEIDDIDQMLNDLHAALNGTMTADRERELLDRLDFDANLDDDIDDTADRTPDEPAADSWEAKTATAVAQVNSAWEDVAKSSPVLSPDDTADDFERRMNPANYAAACAAYEQAVIEAGAVIGERADQLIEERLAGLEPGSDFIAEQELRKAFDARDANDAEGLAALKELYERVREQHRHVLPHAAIRAQAYRDVLNDIRPLGGAQPVLGGKRPYPVLVEQLTKVSNDVPADWIDRINADAPPLLLRMDSQGRAHYNHTRNLIKGDSDDSTMYHEFGHRLEHGIPQISVATNEFLRRRTTREDGRRQPERRYARGEKVRQGGFVHGYVGKSYGPPATEVFSVGMESIFAGSFGGLTGARSVKCDHSPPDLEHRNLMLGILATANRPEQTATDAAAHNMSSRLR